MNNVYSMFNMNVSLVEWSEARLTYEVIPCSGLNFPIFSLHFLADVNKNAYIFRHSMYNFLGLHLFRQMSIGIPPNKHIIYGTLL